MISEAEGTAVHGRPPQTKTRGQIKGVRSLFGNLGSNLDSNLDSNLGFSLLDLSIGFTFFGVSQCHVHVARILQGVSTML